MVILTAPTHTETVCPAKDLRFLPSGLPCLWSSTRICRNVNRNQVGLRRVCQRRRAFNFWKEVLLHLIGNDEPLCAKQYLGWTTSWVCERCQVWAASSRLATKVRGDHETPSPAPTLPLACVCQRLVLGWGDDGWLPMVDSTFPASYVFSLVFAMTLEIGLILYQWQPRVHGGETRCPECWCKRGTMQSTEDTALSGGLAFFYSF